MADDIQVDFEQAILSESGSRYQNLQPLGAGRNATTFLVLATLGPFEGTLFALKLFKRLAEPDRRERFLNESAFLRDCNVFQLGLVLAELFTGSNPQKPVERERRLDPVELNELEPIPGSLRGSIATLIADMLKTDPAERKSASQFLVPWQSVFLSAAKLAHSLEGRVF